MFFRRLFLTSKNLPNIHKNFKQNYTKKSDCPKKKTECPPKKPSCPPKKSDCPPKKPNCPPKKPERPKKPECPAKPENKCKKPKEDKCAKKEPKCGGKVLENKVALITGGNRGIGYEICRAFLKNGLCALTIADLDEKKGEEAIKNLTCEFGENRAMFIECDVSESTQFDWAFKNVIQQYNKIDILVNNAGIMNDKCWHKQIEVNVEGCVIGTLLGMQYMSKSCFGNGGIVVNMASIMGLIPSSGYPIHTLTQYGIVGFTRAMGYSNQYDRTGVKLLGYCPSLTDTQMMCEAFDNTINAKFCEDFKQESSSCKLQKPMCVALGLVKVLEKFKNGSIWVVENGADPYEINFPDLKDMKC